MALIFVQFRKETVSMVQQDFYMVGVILLLSTISEVNEDQILLNHFII